MDFAGFGKSDKLVEVRSACYQVGQEAGYLVSTARARVVHCSRREQSGHHRDYGLDSNPTVLSLVAFKSDASNQDHSCLVTVFE